MRLRRSLKNPYKASVQVILKFDNKIKFVKFITNFKVCSTADIFNGCSSRLVGSNSGILVVYLWSPSGLTQVVSHVDTHVVTQVVTQAVTQMVTGVYHKNTFFQK